MACEFQVLCQPAHYPGAVDAATQVLDLVEALEDQLTVYRESSEIMRINRDACHRACPVEPCLFGLLRQCAAWCEETGGAFDITAGPLIKLWGFHAGRAGCRPTSRWKRRCSVWAAAMWSWTWSVPRFASPARAWS